MSLITRSDRGLVARWWFTVDWPLMSAILILMAAGVMVSMAASPPVAARIGLDSMHFVKSQLFYIVFAGIGLVTLSFFSETWIRRFGALIFLGAIGAMVAALFIGPEIKGAHRWLDIGPVSVQPSEFAKPSFVIVLAWLIAEHLRRPDMPARYIATGVAAAFLGLLVLQPDFGQAALVTLTLGSMLMIAGMSWLLVAAFALAGSAALFLAYTFVPHVASRIDRFMYPDKGDSFQIDTAMEAFGRGGFVGTGPGGGQAKLVLPDAHTDFTLAVIGEEYGMVACVVLVALFFFVVLRVFARAKREEKVFPALALAGLGTLIGLQACINMGVNVALLPAKGMTLPFISYGGSSLLGSALTMGFALSLGRSSSLMRRVVLQGQARA